MTGLNLKNNQNSNMTKHWTAESGMSYMGIIDDWTLKMTETQLWPNN